MDGSQQAHWWGVPIEPDVRRIREVYSNDKLYAGQVIPYEDVAQLIREHPRSTRFRSVTNKWRKIVREDTTFVIDVIPNQGFYVATDNSKVDLASKHLRKAFNQMVRVAKIQGNVHTKELSPDRLKAYQRNSERLGQWYAIQQSKSNKKLPSLM